MLKAIWPDKYWLRPLPPRAVLPESRLWYKAVLEDNIVAPGSPHTKRVPVILDVHARIPLRHTGEGAAEAALRVPNTADDGQEGGGGRQGSKDFSSIEVPASAHLGRLHKRVEHVRSRLGLGRTLHELARAHLTKHRGRPLRSQRLACGVGASPSAGERPAREEMHRRRNGRRAVTAAQPVDPKDGIMHGLNTQATQLHRHAGGHNPAPLHGLDVLEGETALAVVLVRAGRKVGGMLFGERDEARTGSGVGLQCEVHHDPPLRKHAPSKSGSGSLFDHLVGTLDAALSLLLSRICRKHRFAN